MAQTKFVLQKALQQNCLPIVVINKVDRETARVEEVENEILDLFCSLDPTDEQLEYPIIYASAREGWASDSMDGGKENPSVEPLLDAIVRHVKPPKIDINETHFKMLVTQTESNQYFGRIMIGKIQSGNVKLLDKIQVVDQTGKIVQVNQVMKIFKKFGVNEAELEEAFAGDIV